jgi:hypothetical protein
MSWFYIAFVVVFISVLLVRLMHVMRMGAVSSVRTLRYISGSETEEDVARRPGLVAQFAAMTPQQRLQTGLILLGLVSFIWVMGAIDRAQRQDRLRALFHLPADSQFTAFRGGGKRSLARPQLEGTYTFSAAAFDAYVKQLDSAAVWTPGAVHYDGTTVATTTYPALRWRSLPLPPFAGERRVRWGNLSADEAGQVRNGRALCMVLQPEAKPGKSYQARACHELARNEPVSAIMLGLLDYDTKTLHMFFD